MIWFFVIAALAVVVLLWSIDAQIRGLRVQIGGLAIMLKALDDRRRQAELDKPE